MISTSQGYTAFSCTAAALHEKDSSSRPWYKPRRKGRLSGYGLCYGLIFCLLTAGRVTAQDLPSAAGFKDTVLPPIAHPVFRLDQFGYVGDLPKRAVFVAPAAFLDGSSVGKMQKGFSRILPDSFAVYRINQGELHEQDRGGADGFVAGGLLPAPVLLQEWSEDRLYYPLKLDAVKLPGGYQIKVFKGDSVFISPVFRVRDRMDFVRTGFTALLHYFHRQRANTALEWKADAHLKLKGSNRRVDLRGGWCDASGDVSKYFSHLAYTDFMSPQQIPLVTWSLIQATEKLPRELRRWGLLDAIRAESIWGADYLMRSLSDSGYFYMTVFSYFKKEPAYREIVGLEANSVTTTDYACAFREGAGMAIAALARISRWQLKGAFTADQYLKGAERAYRHLLSFNRQYDDDGTPNIIDDYCGLMAATELWAATGDAFYRGQARRWSAHLCARYVAGGYLRADGEVLPDGSIRQLKQQPVREAAPRPFWHASDAGLPVLSLFRYLDREKDQLIRARVVRVIQDLLGNQLAMNTAVPNPFGYPRQQFLYKGQLRAGFFMPHVNESGWWWQGENARLASLAAEALLGLRLTDTAAGKKDMQAGDRQRYALSCTAMHQLSWITGCNPYGICFLYGFGRKNVPYMHANYGHGSERGGISNGITGLNADGTGIVFKTEDQGNEWRWTEQWLPHAAWYLQALTAVAGEY